MIIPIARCVLLGFPGLLGVAGWGSLPAVGDIQLKAVPDHIRVGAFYHGVPLHVDADVPACDDVAVKVEGAHQQATLNKRGRVLGIWLNVAQVTVNNAPQAYLLAASRELDDICPVEEQAALGLGFEALRTRMACTSEQPLTGREPDQFVQLKKHAGTYAFSTNVDLSWTDGDRRHVCAVLPIPATMSAGQYTLRLYCFEHGRLVHEASAPISIEMVGLPRLLTGLALAHPAVHGLVAIGAALVAGLVMGVVFNPAARRRR